MTQSSVAAPVPVASATVASATVELTPDQITDLITPKTGSPDSAAGDHNQHDNQDDKTTPAEPPVKKQKKNKKNGVQKKEQQRKQEPTKPFTDKLPAPIRLVDLKNYQFIPREVELEEFDKVIKQEKTTIPLPPAAPATSAQPPIKKPTDTDNDKPIASNNKPAVKQTKNNNQLTIKETRPKPDPTVVGTKQYWRELKDYNQYHQTRRSVQFIIPIGPKTPKVLLLSSKQNLKTFVIPGGSLKHDEEESIGVQRVWNELFEDSKNKHLGITKDVEFREVVGTWYRPDWKINTYPYDPKLTTLKEIIKVYLVQLPSSGKLTFNGVYETLKPVAFYDLYDSSDPQIKNIPSFLSNYRYE